MSATSAMAAVKAILPVGTNIQQTVIESSLDLLTGAFPALIVSCPRSKRMRVAVGKHDQKHTIHVQYIDVYDHDGQRTIEQTTADLRAVLEAMVVNLFNNPTLSSAVVIAGDDVEQVVDGVVTDDKLPRPVVSGQLIFEVYDLWTN